MALFRLDPSSAVRMLPKRALLLLALLLFCSGLTSGKGRTHRGGLQQQTPPAASGQMNISVTDQNGQPLSSVLVVLLQDDKTISLERTTPSGIAILRQLAPGTYKVLLEKQGFYTATVAKAEIAAGQTLAVEVRLQPVREYREEIEVTAQPSPIDPEQNSNSQSITASDISTIPYPRTRDYRNVLPYIPGVVADSSGQIHMAGSSTQQIQDYLDGFEVSQPAGGALSVRLNPDSLRKIDVLSSRYSAQFGKGSGGLTDLQVQDGDNHFRANATDFIPTLQNVKGIHFNNWTPRGYLSGPIVKDKLWFDLSHESEKDLDIVKELPDGADTNPVWETAELARARMNLTPGNVVTASALLNLFHSEHSGITAFDPVSVSSNQRSTLYMLALKDQLTISKSTLLEFGAAYHRTNNSLFPLGNAPYVFTPNGRTGNYYLTDRNWSERTQAFTNLYPKPWNWHGTHQFSVGGQADRVIYYGDFTRGLFEFVDANNVLLRQVTFQNAPPFSLNTLESSAYAQDRWSTFQRFILEAGGRWDRDSFTRRDFFSPRVAGTALLAKASETKLTAGMGIYFDRTNLAMASQPVQGSRTDTFFSPVSRTILASFLVDPARLAMPRFVNWSAGIERRLPGRFYLRLDYLSRHGTHGWAYERQPSGTFLLENNKQDRYDAAQITVRKDLKPGYPILFSYTRSKARSNEVVSFSLDDFTTGTQLGGPLLWDAPNQITSWGSHPLFWKLKKFDFACSLLYHTGFPFSTVDEFGQLVSGPAAHRFPSFLTLNPAVERKFNFKGYRWAARIGLNNVTNSQNPTVVDNTVGSPAFLTFFGQGHRTLNGRIRFLGRQ